jgi:glyoxylase-like metal-dependent hydrolase (beta-lactamase superfamily II)
VTVEVVDIAPGLWIWRIEHPGWSPGDDWQKVVTCVCVDAGRERWLIDPLLPAKSDSRVWDRLAERAPTAVALTIPDHLRELADDRKTWSVDAIVERWGARAFGPPTWDPDMGPPKSKVETMAPDQILPGGLRVFRSPRPNDERPLWLAEQRAFVFGDTLTERNGVLRVWTSPTHEERGIPDLRGMLELGLERVIISHGEPLHDRAALERALELPPWPGSSLHIAAYRGKLDIVKRRVAVGADLQARDEEYDKTPVEWAEMGKQREVADYLRSVMAGRAT